MEAKTSFFEKVKMMISKMFTISRIKKAGIGILICAVIAGIGGVYWHRQKVNEHAKIVQARTRIIEVQATRNNIKLLDNEKINELVAEAIGMDESSIEYRQIELTNKDNSHYSEKDDKKHRKQNSIHEFNQEASPMPMEPITSTVPIFKVTCIANNVKYRLMLDAVSGEILSSKISSD